MYDKLTELINKTKRPLTKQDFMEVYKSLGINKDTFLEVHASVSKFGYIINKEYDICDSLIETITSGVVIMMAHTGEFSDPSEWENPPVPKEWHEIINKHRKPFDGSLFVPERIGKVSQLFCRYKNVVNSNHPTLSMSILNNTDDNAWLNHDLDDRKLINPLFKLAKSKGKILLIGVDFDSCTSIHLTEFLSPYSELKQFSCQRLNKENEVEDVVVTTQFIEDGIDNFAEIKERYIEQYKNTDYFKQADLGLGKITLIDAEKLFEIAKDFHTNYRK